MSHYLICQLITEPKLPWQNQAESEIHELKKLIRCALRHSGFPVEFGWYAIDWATPSEERVMGHMPDISEFVYLSWFEWVWYREQAKFLDADWLGVAMDAGQAVSDSSFICDTPSGSQEA
jgi:hypothetical protein